MLKYGYTPNDFNTPLVTPIPKKGNKLTTPSDFRPISVSTSFAIIFEKLILGKIDFDSLTLIPRFLTQGHYNLVSAIAQELAVNF